MTVHGLDKIVSAEPKEVLVQNSLSSKVPAFCVTPRWYISGLEKKVKIGSRSFNYIDYLEAWEHLDCGTFRSRNALADIKDRIAEAFQEIDDYQKQVYNKNKQKRGK